MAVIGICLEYMSICLEVLKAQRRSVDHKQVSTFESFVMCVTIVSVLYRPAGQATNVGGHFPEAYGDPRLPV